MNNIGNRLFTDKFSRLDRRIPNSIFDFVEDIHIFVSIRHIKRILSNTFDKIKEDLNQLRIYSMQELELLYKKRVLQKNSILTVVQKL